MSRALVTKRAARVGGGDWLGPGRFVPPRLPGRVQEPAQHIAALGGDVGGTRCSERTVTRQQIFARAALASSVISSARRLLRALSRILTPDPGMGCQSVDSVAAHVVAGAVVP